MGRYARIARMFGNETTDKDIKWAWEGFVGLEAARLARRRNGVPDKCNVRSQQSHRASPT